MSTITAATSLKLTDHDTRKTKIQKGKYFPETKILFVIFLKIERLLNQPNLPQY